MSRISKKDVEIKFQNFCIFAGRGNPKGKGSLRLDKNFYGYSIDEIISEDGTVTKSFGDYRFSASEMFYYLTALCYGIQFERNQNAKKLEEKYAGFSNSPTYFLNLWIHNNQQALEKLQEMACDLLKENPDDETVEEMERILIDTYHVDISNTNLNDQMLTLVFDMVNYKEISDYMVKEILTDFENRKKDVFEKGIDEGYSIAKVNQELLPEFYNDEDLEKYSESCYEGEENSRQFSPFEFFAKELNDSIDPDTLWERYNDGISGGIEIFIRELKQKPEYKGEKNVDANDDE